MPNSLPFDPRISRISADIHEHGLHVINVLPDDSGPGFGYSIGLFERFGHPEILLFGFPRELMHRIINNIGFDIRNGKQFQADQRDDDVLEGYECEFKLVLPRYYTELVGMALTYYDGRAFPLLQCVLPDKNRQFPWSPACSEWMRANQRTFFEDRKVQ